MYDYSWKPTFRTKYYKLRIKWRATTIITLACIATYIVLASLSHNFISIRGDWLLIFGQYNYLVLNKGWWWQLVTSLFVHISIIHLFFNVLYLYMLGSSFEDQYGTRFFLLTFFLSGIMGNILTLVLGSNIVSAGASGALFGIIGAMTIITGARYGGRLAESLSSLLILLVINSIGGGVNILAHVGGLATGVLLGFAYNKYRKPRYGTYPYTIRYYRY